MSRSVTAGCGSTVRRRRLATIASLLWLNVAMLPCAMAMEAEHACPDCPPDHEQPMASHHGHGDARAELGCVIEQPDCCELDDVSVDDRKSQSDKNDSDDPGVSIGPRLGAARADKGVLLHTTGPPDPGGTATRLHALHCVYLD